MKGSPSTWIAFFLPLAMSCIEPYPFPEIKDDSQFLVIDGFVDASLGRASVKLTRTVPLDSRLNSVPELNATVRIEMEKGGSFLLSNKGTVYESEVPIDFNDRYRVSIQLASGKKYLSDYITIRPTPPIDNLTLMPTDFGLELRVNTRGLENNTRNYLWTFDEVWEYTSAYQSGYEVINNVPVFRTEDIYHCWQTNSSKEVLITSTEKLKDDVVDGFPLVLFPKRTVKLSVKYSVLVRQMAIDRKAYDYFDLLKKNTENLGSLFDPLPSQVIGNVYNEQDRNEIVLGYFRASTVTEKRFTITLFELPEEYRLLRDFSGCQLLTVPFDEIPQLGFERGNLIVSTLPGPPPPIYYYTSVDCADCRRQGGTTARPPFW